MSITVRELMQLPHLQVSLLAGQGGLDREVTWVHTSDLADPWQWHGWGELLLTNGTGLAAGAVPGRRWLDLEKGPGTQ